jgi:cation transport ATPase
VDPLRARRVLQLQDGTRFLCGEECKTRFLLGERNFDTPSRRPSELARVERPSIPDLVREATLPRDATGAANSDNAGARQYDPIIATGAAFLALSLLLLSPSRELGWLAAFLVILSAAVNARIPLTTLRANPSLRVVAPLGLLLASAASLFDTDSETQRWALVGAAVAAIAVSIRNWLHSSLSSSLRTSARELRETLPINARVPARASLVYEEVPSASLRQGALVVVLEGELAPADGVVEEGSGLALRYPKAAQARLYTEGDFILAGTRVLDGAVTVRVRRTGRERGIVRAIELGKRKHQDLAVTSRLRFAVTQWSWLILAPASIAALVWAGPAGAATFLLGVPVLALLASLDVPLEAGALASARRGMFFGSWRAFRDAGRAGTTAMLLRGSLTAGEPIVQQVHPLVIE